MMSSTWSSSVGDDLEVDEDWAVLLAVGSMIVGEGGGRVVVVFLAGLMISFNLVDFRLIKIYYVNKYFNKYYLFHLI